MSGAGPAARAGPRPLAETAGEPDPSAGRSLETIVPKKKKKKHADLPAGALEAPLASAGLPN